MSTQKLNRIVDNKCVPVYKFQANQCQNESSFSLLDFLLVLSAIGWPFYHSPHQLCFQSKLDYNGTPVYREIFPRQKVTKNQFIRSNKSKNHDLPSPKFQSNEKLHKPHKNHHLTQIVSQQYECNVKKSFLNEKCKEK